MNTVKIKKITKLSKKHNRYDLTVSQTSNFYANGILIHNTSVRLANQICDRPLTRLEKIAKWFGFRIEEKEYDYFAASRRVIKTK